MKMSKLSAIRAGVMASTREAASARLADTHVSPPLRFITHISL